MAEVNASQEGLTEAEAVRRVAKEGRNELKEAKRVSPLRLLFEQFNSVIIWILVAAGVISMVAGEFVDAVAILAIVICNAAIGFYQEWSAEKSIAALQQMTAPQAKVRREGAVVMIPASGIVVGDVLVLAAGDVVAADARLLEASLLKCTESALTGESEAVSKQVTTLTQPQVALGDRSNMVFMGTSVAAGAGQGVVVAIAMRTELGRIAGLMAEAGGTSKTPLQLKLNAVGRVLVWATLGIIAFLFLLGLLRGTPPLELFLTAISLAVAAVPEGLPAVVTVALALGVRRMARRQALVRKLAAVETLGSTTVICTDKTGTLTVGEMTVRALYVSGQHYEVTGEGYEPKGTVLVGGVNVNEGQAACLLELATVHLGCNNAHLTNEKGVWKVIGDPTEGALLSVGVKAGGDREHIERQWIKRGEIPFDSDRKRSSVIRQAAEGRLRVLTNGAPGMVLKLCSHICSASGVRALTEPDRSQILSQVSDMAKQGLRVLASAYREWESVATAEFTAADVERDLVFVGLAGMQDPPRPEAKSAVDKCHSAGIRVVMITGDHPETASAIARTLGIASATDQAVTGLELDTLTDEELRGRASRIAVYARVTAEHKLKIVRALKANNEVVAMTGDGVNDAPAIQGADIGIAMGKSGSEVTKQAADMVIVNDNFATIVAAVEEGRGIYDNIRQTLQYLMAGSTGELLLMTLCLFIGVPMPLLPIHLLWINLATDGLPAFCLATNPIDADVMKRPPRGRAERFTNYRFLSAMLFTGCLTAAVALGVYLYELKTGSLAAARTSAFSVLVFAELFRAFGARSETKSLLRMRPLLNWPLVIVVVLSVLVQLGIQQTTFLGRVLKTTQVPWIDSLWFIVLGCLPLVILEIVKAMRLRFASKSRVRAGCG